MSDIKTPCVPCPCCGTCLTQSANVVPNCNAAVYSQHAEQCKFGIVVTCVECETEFSTWVSVGDLALVHA